MTAATVPSGFTDRRKTIIRNGKKILRAIDRYVAQHSLVPDLPVYASGAFRWVADLERAWPDIRAELDGVLKYRADIPRFQDISPDQYRISPDSQWQTFILYGFGTKSELNCSLCPKTTAALESLPGLQTAFFSILAPGKHVPRHKGVTKAFLRCHLGLKVPQQRENCWMDVGGERCVWEEGRAFVFDDTYPHEVWNNTDEERVVLLLDVERPMPTATRLLTRAMMWLFRCSPYYRDANRNQQQWEQRFRDRLRREGVAV
jgi:aspartyl/asparaginyl beta-hydroxylase (cupin superfamily)